MSATTTRYNELTTWTRKALEAHAIALTAQHTLEGATKIRLIRNILQAEGRNSSLTTAPKPGQPNEKYLVVYQGKGTPLERCIETNVRLYWSEGMGRWVSTG